MRSSGYVIKFNCLVVNIINLTEAILRLIMKKMRRVTSRRSVAQGRRNTWPCPRNESLTEG